MSRVKKVKPPRVGRTPDILRKGGAMKDKTKYTRKTNRRDIDESMHY